MSLVSLTLLQKPAEKLENFAKERNRKAFGRGMQKGPTSPPCIQERGLPILRAHSMAVPLPVAFPSAR